MQLSAPHQQAICFRGIDDVNRAQPTLYLQIDTSQGNCFRPNLAMARFPVTTTLTGEPNGIHPQIGVHDALSGPSPSPQHSTICCPSTTQPAASDAHSAYLAAQCLISLATRTPSPASSNFTLLAETSRLTRFSPHTGLAIGSRVRLLPESDARRGTVSFTGLVPEIPGIGAWIGVTLDEPTGKNDGSVKGKRYFECGSNCGVFVRPERCEAGDFPVLDEFDEDLEEL